MLEVGSLRIKCTDIHSLEGCTRSQSLGRLVELITTSEDANGITWKYGFPAVSEAVFL